MTNGSTYHYRVRGVDQVGNVGAWAISASFAPSLIPRPAAPSRHGSGSFAVVAATESKSPVLVSGAG